MCLVPPSVHPVSGLEQDYRVRLDEADFARPMTDAQRRWLEALANHHGVERVPELNASQAGALVSKWAGSLPKETRQELGDQ